MVKEFLLLCLTPGWFQLIQVFDINQKVDKRSQFNMQLPLIKDSKDHCIQTYITFSLRDVKEIWMS